MIDLSKNSRKINLSKNTDVKIAIDFSASMDERDVAAGYVKDNGFFGLFGGGKRANYISRINFAESKTIELAEEAEKFDEDGIDIIPFASGLPRNISEFQNTTSNKVRSVFKHPPIGGTTDTHLAIDEAFRQHCKVRAQNKTAKTVLFIVTDGVPNNNSKVEQSISTVANNITQESEFLIRILTVGDLNSSTERWLYKLDEELSDICNGLDIVDIYTLEGAVFKAMV